MRCFEAWWEAHGFKSLKDRLLAGESPLAAQQTTTPAKVLNAQPNSVINHQTNSYAEKDNEERVSIPSCRHRYLRPYAGRINR